MERTRTVLQAPFTQNCYISIGDISLEGLKREINGYGIWGNLPNFENNCIFKRLFIPSYNEKQYKHTQCLIFDIHPSTPACTYIGKTRNKMVCGISITACRILKKIKSNMNYFWIYHFTTQFLFLKEWNKIEIDLSCDPILQPINGHWVACTPQNGHWTQNHSSVKLDFIMICK